MFSFWEASAPVVEVRCNRKVRINSEISSGGVCLYAWLRVSIGFIRKILHFSITLNY